jgi:PAS domain S-box-containing protein
MDALLDNAPCGFLSFAEDGTILLANQTLLNLLGHESQALLGQHIGTILSMGGRVFYQTHFFPLLKLHGKVEEIYFSLRCKSGESVPVLANAVRRENAAEVAYDCIFVVMRQRDQYEDEILRARKAAEEAEQAKAKFLSMMSHELRTPLNAISGYTDIIAMGLDGPVTLKQATDLEYIKGASNDLLSLINDILGFARMESGELDVQIQAVSVEAALQRASALLFPRLQEAGLEFHREHFSPQWMVQADPDRLQQILLNLLTNAIKFTPRGGQVSVQCENLNQQILIHVRDSGCGIPAEQLQRVFDPFVQVERQRVATQQRGVGLGLAISRDLARAMGGDITVQSTVDVGSVFTVHLIAATDNI